MPFGGLLTAGIGAGTSLLGGIFGGNAAGKASQQYIQALQQAQGQMQKTEGNVIGNYQPWINSGGQATSQLRDLLGTPGQGLLQNWTGQFNAPTAAEAAQTPGYQFQLQQGLNAAQNSAAGNGSLLSGRTLADLNNYAQGTASTNYQNVFNNDLTQYQSAYNTFLNNQNNTYSRLMGESQTGLQGLGQMSQFASGMSGDIASLYGQQGAAAAAGTIGQANAYSGALSGIGNAAQNYGMLSMLNGSGSMANPVAAMANGYNTSGAPLNDIAPAMNSNLWSQLTQ